MFTKIIAILYVIPVIVLNASMITYIRSDVLPLRHIKGHIRDFIGRYIKVVYIPIVNLVVMLWMFLYLLGELYYKGKKSNV